MISAVMTNSTMLKTIPLRILCSLILRITLLSPNVAQQATGDLKPEQVHGCHGHERRATLQHQHEQGWLGRARQPLEGEEPDDRELPCHENLPDVRRSAFVGLTSCAEHSDVNYYGGESAKR